MDPMVFLAALASAIMHAAWNAAAQRRRDPGQGLAVVLYASALAAVPLLIIVGLPAPAAWPWLVGGLMANMISARALMAAYRRPRSRFPTRSRAGSPRPWWWSRPPS